VSFEERRFAVRRYAKYLIASFVLLISVWLILLRAQYAGIAINHWTPTADMAFPRAAACSALLPDGRVLVAGGNSSSGVVNTAELYGTNGTFALAASMLQARAGAACTTMQNGSVLVTGGTDGTSALASAEIYNPSTDTWTSAGSMSVARSGHTATLTPWGAVLIVGGQSNGSVSSVVELFLTNGQFLTVGNLSSPRTNYALTVLPGHQVLIAGGSDGNSALNTIDLFNADNNSVTPAGTMLVARTNFAMAPLLDGTVLISGGYGASGGVLASSEIYDPVKQVSTDGPQLPVSRANHQSYALTNNGQVILAGGVTDGAQALTETDVYQPWTSQFAKTAPLNTARSGDASSLLQRGALIVAGGRNGSGYLTSSEVYGFATIETDKSDYAPGTPVVMTGSGWQPGEQVLVTVTAYPVDKHSVEFTGAALADGTGQIKLTGFQVDKSHLGMKFLLDATGSQSRAQKLFSDTDTTAIGGVTVTPFSPTGYPVDLEIVGTVSDITAPTQNPFSGPNATFAVDGNPVGGSGVALGPTPACPGCFPGEFDTGGTLYGVLSPGSHNIQISWLAAGGAYCGVDNCASSSYSFSYSVNPVATIATTSSTPSTIAYGATANLEAEVDANGPAPALTYPQGAVTFNDGLGTILACNLPDLAPGTNNCTIATPTNLSVGTHNFFIGYNGYQQTWAAAPQAGPITVTVIPAGTSVVLSPSLASPQSYGTAFNLTAGVTPFAATGTVTFYDGAIAISSPQTLVGGSATIAVSTTLSVGTHYFNVIYSGSPDYNSSSAATTPAAYVITADTTTTTVTSTDPTSQAFGSTVHFTATVVDTSSGPNPPGTVTFIDTSNANAVVGTANVPLVATVAHTSAVTISVNNLLCTGCATTGPFTHNIQAVYTPGNSGFQASTSASYGYTVTRATPSPRFSEVVTPNPLTLGGGITVTVNATPSELAGVMPTGNVIIYFSPSGGCGTCGTWPLVNGIATATFSASALEAMGVVPGTEEVSPAYTGDDQYNFYLSDFTSPANYGTFTVSQAATTGSVTSVPITPVYYGNQVTYVANISSSYAGAIGGTAVFKDGGIAINCIGQVLGAVAINSGVAQCVPSDPTGSTFVAPAAGAHAITVVWTELSTANYASGNTTGSPYNIVVNPETTSVTLTPSTNNTTLTSPVTYTAAVNGTPVTPPGGGGTTGSVDFKDVTGAPIPLCTGVLVTAGSATCTVPYTGGAGEGAGTHLVQAFYNPPTTGTYANDFAASSSAQISVTIAPGSVAISAVTSSAGTTPTYGTPTTYSVALTPTGPTPAYTGVVQFLDNGTLLGSVSVCTASGLPYTACPAAGVALYPTSGTGTVPTAGPHNITAQFMGDSNYSPSAVTARLNVTVGKATPTMPTPTAVNSAFGGIFNTGAVSVPAVGSGVTPTGTISLSQAGPPVIAIGSAATLVTGSVTFTGVTLPTSIGVGTFQSITYTYSGDSNYASTTVVGTLNVSTAVIPYTVTSATISSFPAGQNPVYGQPIVLTGTLLALTGVPATGTVNFYDGATIVCTAVPITNSVASCTPASGTFAVGAHTITLGAYSGDTHYSSTFPSSGNTPLGFMVMLAPTITTLSASPVSALPAQPVTFTAVVAVPLPGVATPVGTVAFTEDTASGPLTLCAAQSLSLVVSSYVATCTPVTFSTPGSYTIHATYSGNTTTATSTVVLPYTVNKVQPGIAVVSSIPGPTPNPVYGQPITYTVTVSPPSGTTQPPTGQVTFYDGGVQLIGTTVQTLVGGSPCAANSECASVQVSTLNTNDLTVGTHAITVLYGGDSNFGQITSSILYQTVVQAASTTGGSPTGASVTVTYSGGPVYGQPVTFTARVTAAYDGIPTGTVTFTDAGTGIPGAVATLVPCTTPATTCNWSTATFTLPSGSLPGLSVNGGSPHQIGAVYSGDGNFITSSTGSNNTAVTISPAGTTTTVTVLTTATATYGQSPIILAAQVLPVAPGAGTRVGTISFYDREGNTNYLLGTSGAVDSGGNASIQVAALASSGFQNIGSSGSIVGNHDIVAVYNGPTGTPADPNFATSSSVATPFTLTINKATTTTSVVSSVTPTSVFGQPVQFTATVTAAGSFGISPTGTVTFVDGATTIGTGTLAPAGANSSTATLTLPNLTGGLSLAVGAHSISVAYGGDPNYGASATPAGSPLVQTVIKANTTTALATSCSSSATGCVVGQSVTLVASITVNSPGAGVPTGTVQFYDIVAGNNISLGASAPLLAGGSSASPTYTATLALPNGLPQGNLQLIAVYSGDGSFNTSTSPILTQGINTDAVTVVVTASQTNVTYGTPITFTVTVTAVNTSTPPVGLPTPTGLVTFYDGGAAMCSGIQLGGGTAVCTPTMLVVGTHAISVQYTPTQAQGGAVNFQPNASPAIAVIVSQIPTSLSLSSASCNPCVAGQPVTFTAQVVANSPSGVPYPSGQVSFIDGSYTTGTNLLGVGTLLSGIATLAPSVYLAPGVHQIYAVYNGDNLYTGSTSSFLPMTVNVAATTTTIASSVNPSVVGQTVVFTVTVAVVYPSTYLTNGQVQLWDNQVALGSPVSANNGTFTIPVPGFTPGTHNIYATFVPNGSFSTSTSPTLTQIVNKAPTVTTLAALPLSSTSSQSVVLTAVVNVPAPGAGTPTGTVQFVDTTFNQILGTAPLNMIGGVYTATITTSQMVQSGAPQLLTATYSGDANFATSTSVPQGQTVFGNQVTITSAASYYSSNFAPDSWATAWGTDLSTATLYSSTTPLPTSLAGTTIEVTDAAGVQRLAQLSFVSSGQINFLIPTNTAAGLATVTVTNSFGATASTIIVVSPTSPGLFSQDSSGSGLAAGQYIVVHADGSQTNPNQIAQYNSATGQWVAVPIVAGATDQVYLVLYGTGIRHTPSASSVTATVNGKSVTVAYAGPQAQFAGEDQVNLGPLPSFMGAGVVNVQITVNGEPSNTVTVDFQ
jgi:hypothetical protein